jgi:nitroreductase
MVDTAGRSLLSLIRSRYSAEEFQPGAELDEALIRQLVEDATWAPSSFNIQHWRFVAVRRTEDKQKLMQAAYGQEQVGRSAVTFIILGDTRGAEKLPQSMELAIARGAIAEGKAAAWSRMVRELYADPQLARDEALRSASLAAMTMMLSAEARGLAAGALAGFDAEAVRRIFGIDERYVPVMLLAVGYPLGQQLESKRMPRLPVEAVLSLDRFGG